MSHTEHGAKGLHQKAAIDRKATGRHEQVAVAAYSLAGHRGFSGGDTVADWLPKLKPMQYPITVKTKKSTDVEMRMTKLETLGDDMKNEITALEWSVGMSVGIPEIDEDHKQFMALVNGFTESVASRMAHTDVKKRLQNILDNAEQHFGHERILLKECHYPGLRDHALKHAQLMNLLRSIMANTVTHGYDFEWVAVGQKINAALIDHVLTEGKKFAAFYLNSLCADSAGKTETRLNQG